MYQVTKHLLFTVHFVNGQITCVRNNLTGKFVSEAIYLALFNNVKAKIEATISQWQKDLFYKDKHTQIDKYLSLPRLEYALRFPFDADISQEGNNLVIVTSCNHKKSVTI